MDATTGAIRGSGTPGIVELDPRTEELGKLVAAGVVTQARVIAEVTEPLAVARMLLKIGLEELGKYFYEVAISERVLEARSFARRPKRGESWWFVLRGCPEECILEPGSRECSIEIFEREGILISAMHMHSAKEAAADLGGASTLWLDLHSLLSSYISIFGRDAVLSDIYYFSALAKHIDSKRAGTTKKHQDYIDCLKSTGVKVRLGRFKYKTIWRGGCRKNNVHYE